jgi:hypothetical protein
MFEEKYNCTDFVANQTPKPAWVKAVLSFPQANGGV